MYGERTGKFTMVNSLKRHNGPVLTIWSDMIDKQNA